MTQAAALRALILEASEYLDPQHQGLGWPDPIAWDGRDLKEQARDMTVLLDAPAQYGEAVDERAAELSAALWAAGNA